MVRKDPGMLKKIMLLAFLSGVFAASVFGQEPFDRYLTFASKDDERFHLDNFAIYLWRHPDDVGYILFYLGDDATLPKVRKRVYAAKNYLVQTRKVQPGRIRIVYGGLLGLSMTVLQPLPKGQKFNIT